MRNLFDLSPYRRSLIGFDRLFNILEDTAPFDVGGYPAYDLEQDGEDAYRIRLAVSGYAAENIDITVQDNVLVVAGQKLDQDTDRKYLHRGIPAGAFERRFHLADHVKVVNAGLADGILDIELRRDVPEAAKPKKITISRAATPKQVTGTATEDLSDAA